MNRSLVRAVYAGDVKPSRRIYGAGLAQALDAARSHIRVLELEGALFFGSTEKLGEQVEALAAQSRFVVLDLSRLSAIDVTGAIALERLLRRAGARGTALLLAGAPQQRAQLLATPLAHVERAPWFADADLAIEHAERALLGAVDMQAEIAPEQFALARGLDQAGLALLREALTRQTRRAGEVLFREGDPGDTLFVLAAGTVTIAIGHAARGDHRLVTFAPGAIFGEAAMLDGRIRSATATVVEDAVLYALKASDLDWITARSPETTIAILSNLGRHLSVHLRRTTDTLRDLWNVRG
jgi:SulP family sulfate permease